MDQDAINLAKAIRQIETGNKPVRGQSGELASRYQFLPSTWKSWAGEILGNPNAPLTLENENKVAYTKIKGWKDQGYNPAQIASMWNSGKPDWQGKVGVNKYGVKYDVPSYVNKVYSAYKQVKANTPQSPDVVRTPITDQRYNRSALGLPVAVNPDRVEPTLGGTIARDLLGGVFAKGLESVKAIPKALRGEDINQSTFSKYLGKDVSRIGAGFDATKGLTKENLRAVKDSVASGIEASSYLPFGRIVSGSAQVLKTGAKTFGKEALKRGARQVGANVFEGAVGTAMYEGGRRLQGEKDRGNFLENVAYGAGGAGLLGMGGAVLGRGARQARRTFASLGGNIPQDIAEESTQRLKSAWGDVIDDFKDLRTFNTKQVAKGRDMTQILTDEVIVPKIENSKLNLDEYIPQVQSRIDEVVGQVADLAKAHNDIPIKLDDFAKKAELSIKENESIKASGKINRALKELDDRIAGFKSAYGDTINPEILNSIRIAMNREYRDRLAEMGIKDVATAIGDAVRDELDRVINDDVFRRANQKAGDLITLENFIQKVNGKNVGGGRFSQAFAGIVGARAVGALNKAPVVGEFLGYVGGRKLQKEASKYAFGSAGPRTRSILKRMARKNEIGEEIIKKTAERKQLLLPEASSPYKRQYASGKTIELPKRAQSTVDKEELGARVLEKIKKGDEIKIGNETVEVSLKLEDGVVVRKADGTKKFIKKAELASAEQAFGAIAGLEIDENGELKFNKEKALMGVGGLAVAKKAGLMKGAKNISDDLIQEAKKYKSYIDFVESAPRGRIYDSISNTKRKVSEFATKNDDSRKGIIKWGQAGTSPKDTQKWIKKIKKGDRPAILLSQDPFSKTEYVLDGHNRLIAYQKLGIEEIPVVYKHQLKQIWEEANKKSIKLPKPYKGEKDLTTKILKDLEGKTTVSKQYILDATNRGELKQVERDLIRAMVENEPKEINVNKFAKKVKAELLPLKIVDREMSGGGGTRNIGRYENIVLPDEIRGDVESYGEHLYNSPIKTSAGQTHFAGTTGSNNYFGHTRIEDMADDKTRRVIEVQSDLYQKGNLEKELGVRGTGVQDIDSVLPKKEADRYFELKNELFQKDTAKEPYLSMKKEFDALTIKAEDLLNKKYKRNKLQQYNNPTAHFRMVREEIKKASQDGKTKLQFPTGETAMKIEGLGERHDWFTSEIPRDTLIPTNLKVGQSVYNGQDWIITDVLGDGKFKAVQKSNFDKWKDVGIKNIEEAVKNVSESAKETFDISGKVDTSNPIYKFYEKDLQKYLNKFGGKRVVDENGVEWIEVPIKKEWGNMPVEAFAMIPFAFAPRKEKVIEETDEYKTTKTGLFGSNIKVEKKDREQFLNENLKKEKPILENKETAVDPTPEIANAIEKAYKKYPEIPKGFIETVLMMESSMATNPANKNEKLGEYAWVGGITEVAKEELKKAGIPTNLSTLEGAIQAIADFVEIKRLFRNKNGTIRYIDDPVKLYFDRYNGGGIENKWGAEKLEQRKQDFNKLLAYYGK